MTGAGRLERCNWCDRKNVLASEWEQERLNNPWNALLPMRKIGRADSR